MSSSAITAGRGSPGIATRPMISMRPTSQNTITVRYGYRSASETSTDPPRSHGAYEMANAAADATTDSVIW